jgi:hypothetical protein
MKRFVPLLILVFIFASIMNACGPKISPEEPQQSTPTHRIITETSLLLAEAPGMASTSAWPPIPEPLSPGKIFVVNTATDNGPGSLRQAMLDAQRSDEISFDPAIFPPNSPTSIILTSSLPEISQGNLTIDASNAGVILDGSQVTGHGLSISSNSNTIRGLQIVGFSDAGIGLFGGAKFNIIGGDPKIGIGQLGQGNLLSGNGNFGIGLWNTGTSYNTIQGNLIGIGLDTTYSLGQARDGIHSNGADNNLITSNVIGGNDSGIYLCCAANGNNIVTNNIIGTDAGGENDLGNNSAGIILDRTGFNIIGPNNIIAYNTGQGISLWDETPFNTITKNSIYNNGEQGINLNSPSRLAAPIIFDFDLQAGILAGVTCPNCIVEVFSDYTEEGAFYEGQTVADDAGVFIINTGVIFTGPHLSATTTDSDGNTSNFSAPTSGTNRMLTLQEGNILSKSPIQPKRSQELEDNHIGNVYEGYDRYSNTESIYGVGYKWMRLLSLTEWGALNESGIWQENLPVTVNTIPSEVDEKITDYANNDITTVLNLSAGAGLDLNSPFNSEDEIDQFTEYVRMVVRHFKGRIHYYEIWNEPTGKIEVADYVRLIKRVVPVIKEEDSEARIAIGAFAGHWETGYPGYGEYHRNNFDLDYMMAVLRSGVAPLVDVISWHPFFGNIPSDPYYQNYPKMVKQIKDVAISEGFTGEYLAEELFWTIVVEENWPGGPPVSQLVAAKLFARAIVTHRGLDVTVAINDFFLGDRLYSIHNLNDTFAGASPINLSVEIENQSTNIMSYGFSLPNGDKMYALWINGDAVDEDPGIPSTLSFIGFAGWNAIGIDVINGFEQELISTNENGNLIIYDFFIKDFPIIIRLSR